MRVICKNGTGSTNSSVCSAQLDHMNAEVVLSIVVWLSCNTRYSFRIITVLLISAIIITLFMLLSLAFVGVIITMTMNEVKFEVTQYFIQRVGYTRRIPYL